MEKRGIKPEDTMVALLASLQLPLNLPISIYYFLSITNP